MFIFIFIFVIYICELFVFRSINLVKLLSNLLLIKTLYNLRIIHLKVIKFNYNSVLVYEKLKCCQM
jgi:hypothetical protein